MPRENQPAPEKQNPEEILAQVNAQTRDYVPPPAPPMPSAETAQAELPKQGQAVLGSDGRTVVYQYTDADGEKFILPRPVDQMSIEDFERAFKLSINDALPGRLPQNLTVLGKDPQWAFHWFNCQARRGRRLADARALGFIPAHAEDLADYMQELNDKDGAIRDDDLVLFKIHKAQLFLYALRNTALAKKLGGKEKYMNTAESEIHGRAGDKVGYYYAAGVEKEFTGLGPLEAVR